MDIAQLKASLALPAIAAPMYLLSGPELVIACCRAGIVGSFNSLNAATPEACEQWLTDISTGLEEMRDGKSPAPFALNLIVRPSDRFDSDCILAERFKVPIVITSVGSPGNVVQRVHGYGGLVFHDVATLRHAEKAIAAGVDGLILLTAGAGGHTGQANPFAFVREVRRIWDGAIVLAGAISDGRSIRAAEVLGADFAYLGTRFAATSEARAPDAYKAMLVSEHMGDVMMTDRISGLPAFFLKASLRSSGLDPDALPALRGPFTPDLPEGIRPWRDIWSAGQGVGMIDDVPDAADLIARLAAEYREAL